MRAFLLAIFACGSLAACGARSGSDGPDEFSVLPVKLLEIPATLALPPPTPDGVNRADRDPQAEAAAALGGNPAVRRQDIPAIP